MHEQIEMALSRVLPPSTPRELTKAVADLVIRRQKQDALHGGPEHDDREHPNPAWWISTITDYNARASACHYANNPEQFRSYMLDVAALALAAIEMHDRKRMAQRMTQVEGA